MNPLGLGDWRICTSLISGFMAKESVVSTFNVLFGSNVGTVLNSASAVSMLVFSLLYTPCVASIAAIKRELGARWSLGVVVWQCFIAWIAASIAHLISSFSRCSTPHAWLQSQQSSASSERAGRWE